ncbi:hypothetical protein [Streptomyces sp. NPDC002845]
MDRVLILRMGGNKNAAEAIGPAAKRRFGSSKSRLSPGLTAVTENVPPLTAMSTGRDTATS